MFKQAVLFFYISVAWCDVLFSMGGNIVDPRLSGKAVYTGTPSSNFKEFCGYAVEKIYENSEGEKLLKKISAFLLESSIAEVRFVDSSGGGGGTAFVHNAEFDENMAITGVPDNILCIHINLDNAIRVVSPEAPSWCDQLFGISECIYDDKKVDEIISFFRIAKIFSPFYVTVAHEFIHLKHFLETLLHKGDPSYIPYGEAIALGTYNQLTAEPRLCGLPELNEKDFLIKRSIPWDNFEERRTVVGPDIDGISELSFRVMGALPIRYIYIRDQITAFMKVQKSYMQ